MRMFLRFAALVFCYSLGFGQSATNFAHPKTTIDCLTCHSCNVPTKADPCLKNCPRSEAVTVHHRSEESPDTLLLDAIKEPTDLYKPVVFSHRSHAQMTELSGDCSNCHHYNPPGAVLPCKECHESNSAMHRADLARPGLKGAYHRQCLGCHRLWSQSTECESCHEHQAGKSATGAANRTALPSTTRPVRFVYETASPRGKYVTFSHNDYVQVFGLSCIDCHRNETCISCHSVNKDSTGSGHPVVDREQQCYSCHTAEGNCSTCHSNKPRDSFNHLRRSGFALARYHAHLSCSECHGTTSGFKGLDKSCTSCHQGWQAGAFNHATTGLALDEVHTEMACEDCHVNRNFLAKPTCSNCHEDKTYPKDRPGKMVQPAR